MCKNTLYYMYNTIYKYEICPLIAIKIFHGSNVGDFLELIAIQLDTFGMRMYVVLCQHNLT